MHLQAQETQGHRYYETAPLTISVSPGSSNKPSISFNTDDNTGYVYEMSPSGSLLFNKNLTEAVRVIVSDADLVRNNYDIMLLYM